MIKESLGDVLQAEEQIIAHQTNCVGVMGAGVAVQIKNKLLGKRGYDNYRALCKAMGNKLLGNVQFLEAENSKIVANVFGENVPTGRGIDTDYAALKNGMEIVERHAKADWYDVAIPGLMGCGLAGGDWNIVYNDILVPIFENSTVNLHIVFFLEEDYNKWKHM